MTGFPPYIAKKIVANLLRGFMWLVLGLRALNNQHDEAIMEAASNLEHLAEEIEELV